MLSIGFTGPGAGLTAGPAASAYASPAQVQQPFLRGRVMHQGRPVPFALVELLEPPLPAGQRVHSSQTRRLDHADAGGYFRLPIKPSKTESMRLAPDKQYRLRAWDSVLGVGELNGLTLNLQQPAQDLEIHITQAPGDLVGRVILPEGRSFGDLVLTAPPNRSYLYLNKDGSFRMAGLPSGSFEIRIIKNSSKHWTLDEGQKGTWFSDSHRLRIGPAWMSVLPRFEVMIPAGGEGHLELDLSKPALCFLEGKLSVNGNPPAPSPGDHFTGPFRPIRPRVFLGLADAKLHGHTQFYEDVITHATPSEKGTFKLGVHRPGPVLLSAEFALSDAETIFLLEPMLLQKGTRPWEFDVTTAELEIRMGPKRSKAPFLNFSLEGTLPSGVAISYRARMKHVNGVIHVPHAPVGNFNLIERKPDRDLTLWQVEIPPGRTTLIELPDER